MLRCIFGGSFDPVHTGHITVALAAGQALGAGAVHLVPAAVQPLKADRRLASAEDRLAMLRLATREHDLLVVDDREVRRGGVSYTVDTLREMRAEFAADRLCLMIGADAAHELPQWRERAEITRLAQIVVLTRPGAPAPRHRLIDGVLEVPAVAVSATEIRGRVARGEPIRGLVPDAVAEYIAFHGLYRADD
jgi:nicotinate-nucleotide adenylyltransferase